MAYAYWPHKDICANFNMVMGTQQGKTAMPATRLRDAVKLHAAIVHKLDLKIDPDAVQDELLSEIIKATLDEYDDDPNIRSSRELLGFTKLTQDEIDNIAADPDSKLCAAARRDKYENKGFRLYLARLHQDKGGWSLNSLRDMQTDTWAPAMATALRRYLDDHRAEALAIAADLGLAHVNLITGNTVQPVNLPPIHVSPPTYSPTSSRSSRKRPSRPGYTSSASTGRPIRPQASSQVGPQQDAKKSSMRRRETRAILFYLGLLASFPAATALLPRLQAPLFRFVDENVLTSNPWFVWSCVLILGLMSGIAFSVVITDEESEMSFGAKLAIFIVLALVLPGLTFANIVGRLSVYSSDTALADTIRADITAWTPVILNNGTFNNYQDGCDRPKTQASPDAFGRVYRLDVPMITIGGDASEGPTAIGGYPGEQESGAKKAYVPTARKVSADEYQCSVTDGTLKTRLSLSSDDIMVTYLADGGKSVGHNFYYIEAEVRPTDGGRLSSCLLAIAQPSKPEITTTVFSVVNVSRDGRQAHVAKVFSAIGQPTEKNAVETEDVVIASDPLPFVQRYSVLDDYSDWTKLALYKKDNKVSFMVDDRVVATYDDTSGADVFPELATRAGTGTTGGVAACEFKNLRAYSAG